MKYLNKILSGLKSGGTMASDFLSQSTGPLNGAPQKMFGSLMGAGKATLKAFDDLDSITTRPLLTGKFANTSFTDAYFPNLNKKPLDDLTRFGLNKRVPITLAGFGAVGMVAGGAQQTFYPTAPPPTLYHDGTQIRHVNDMGANASYGQKMMGKNSLLGMQESLRRQGIMGSGL
jgi:hypothetical protein